MENRKYSSYAQIDRELEILKIEKEIHYQKLIFGFQKTKESFAPKNIIKDFVGSYKPNVPGTAGVILNIAIPLIKWFFNKKRGN